MISYKKRDKLPEETIVVLIIQSRHHQSAAEVYVDLSSNNLTNDNVANNLTNIYFRNKNDDSSGTLKSSETVS
jgi:hypothetical protein